MAAVLGPLCALEGPESAADLVPPLTPLELEHIHHAVKREAEIGQEDAIFTLLEASPLAGDGPPVNFAEASQNAILTKKCLRRLLEVTLWWKEVALALDCHRLRRLQERKRYLTACLRPFRRRALLPPEKEDANGPPLTSHRGPKPTASQSAIGVSGRLRPRIYSARFAEI